MVKPSIGEYMFTKLCEKLDKQKPCYQIGTNPIVSWYDFGQNQIRRVRYGMPKGQLLDCSCDILTLLVDIDNLSPNVLVGTGASKTQRDALRDVVSHLELSESDSYTDKPLAIELQIPVDKIGKVFSRTLTAKSIALQLYTPPVMSGHVILFDCEEDQNKYNEIMQDNPLWQSVSHLDCRQSGCCYIVSYDSSYYTVEGIE
jgi:hypothetical protein